MFILTTEEGRAFHFTDGLPAIYPERLERVGSELKDSDWLELDDREAQELRAMAFMAIYGRRHGLDV